MGGVNRPETARKPLLSRKQLTVPPPPPPVRSRVPRATALDLLIMKPT